VTLLHSAELRSGRFGVPINDFFEHLSATIAEAAPFYELCAIVLDF
jgi:hypothetical protein